MERNRARAELLACMRQWVLFPNITFINKNVGTLDGSYQFHSPSILNLTIPSLDLPIGEALNIHADNVTLTPGQTILMTIGSATISSPSFSGLPVTTISNLQIKKTGLSLGNCAFPRGSNSGNWDR